jgi:CCR4-NOT transcription complex subunit 2
MSSSLLLADRTFQSTCRSAAFSSAEKIINDSDFPSLGGTPFTPSVPTTSYGNNSPIPTSGLFAKDAFSALQRAPYVLANLMRNNGDGSTSLNSNSEFHIMNEDFPALPGANTSLSQNNAPSSKNGENSGNSDGTNSTQTARYSEAHTQNASTESKPGIQTHPDGLVTNIPPGMLNDQYGMAGLLTFLRTLDSDPSIVALALGHDLTNLGLNLNSSERNLYQTFGGPWADYPCRIQDLDAKVPEEYLTNATIRDKLPNIKLNKLSDDVLFYLFYNCPGEVYQTAAALEL